MRRELNRDEWVKEAEARFGEDPMDWAFVCPACKHVARLRDWHSAGAPSSAAAFSCVGRWLPGSGQAFTGVAGSEGPCNYAGGGLLRLNPVSVSFDGGRRAVFEFATPEEVLATRGRQEAGEA